jgi:hypothetical protein
MFFRLIGLGYKDTIQYNYKKDNDNNRSEKERNEEYDK